MAKIRKVIEEIEEDVERVVVTFLSHVRHDGKDFFAGDVAAIAPAHADALIQAGAAQAVEVALADAAPASDPAADIAADGSAPAAEEAN